MLMKKTRLNRVLQKWYLSRNFILYSKITKRIRFLFSIVITSVAVKKFESYDVILRNYLKFYIYTLYVNKKRI